MTGRLISGARSTPDLFTRLEAVPGVMSAGGTTRLPLGGTNVTTKVDIEGRGLPPGEWPGRWSSAARCATTSPRWASRSCGAAFTDQDGPTAPPVAVINERMARRLLPGEDPIGRRIRFGSTTAPWVTIVGVIGDVRHSALDAEPLAGTLRVGICRIRRRTRSSSSARRSTPRR